MSKKGDRTREKILLAAGVLLRERGPGHVTMGQVAEAAGMTRQAVYLHFRSRTTLMLALVDHVGEQLGVREAFRSPSPPATARELLLGRLSAGARYSAKVHDVAKELDLARHSDEAARAAWDDRMARRRRGMKQVVRQLDAEGELNPEWTVRQVVDALFVLTAPRTYADLVVERGWGLSQYESFLVTTAQSFLRHERSSSRR